MADSSLKQSCPHCRRENPAEARFCTICGGTMGGERESYGPTLFFGTPGFLLVFGLAISYDVSGGGLTEFGFSLGLALITLYFFSCGALYLPARLLGKAVSLEKAWEAGIFGVFQFGAVLFLQIPLVEWFSREFAGLSLTQEAQLKESLLLVVFLPILAAGVALLIRRLPGSSTPPAPPWPALFSPVTLIALTLGTGVLIYLGLPVHQKHFIWAKLWVQYGSLRKAGEQLEKSLSAKSDFPAALHLKGLVQLSRRTENETELPQAIKSLQQAHELEPANPRYLMTLSLAHELALQRPDAVRCASMAVSLMPGDPLLWSTFADLLQRHQRMPEAIQAYRKALTLTPADPRLLNNLAYTLLETGQDKGSALELAKESVRLMPDSSFNLDTLGWAYYHNGMAPEALEFLRQARELASGSPEIEFHFGVIAMNLGLLASPTQFFTTLASRPELSQDPSLQHHLVEFLASMAAGVPPLHETMVSEIPSDTSVLSPAEELPATSPVAIPASPGTLLNRQETTASEGSSP